MTAKGKYVKFNDALNSGIEDYARDLGVPMIAVTSGLVGLGVALRSGIALDAFIAELRTTMGQLGESRVVLCEFTDEQWAARKNVYEKFNELGLIEDFRAKPSLNYANRWIASFRVSDSGRVLADVLSRAGTLQSQTSLGAIA